MQPARQQGLHLPQPDGNPWPCRRNARRKAADPNRNATAIPSQWDRGSQLYQNQNPTVSAKRHHRKRLRIVSNSLLIKSWMDGLGDLLAHQQQNEQKRRHGYGSAKTERQRGNKTCASFPAQAKSRNAEGPRKNRGGIRPKRLCHFRGSLAIVYIEVFTSFPCQDSVSITHPDMLCRTDITSSSPSATL